MANSKIKGLVVEIGGDTTKLGKALDSVDKQSRGLSSELEDVNRLLKLDPKNTELLGQKQQILAEVIGQTSKRLEALHAANGKAIESSKNYDKWKKRYEPLQEESDKLKEQLKQLQKQQRAIAEEDGPESEEYKALQPEVDKVRDALKLLQKQQRDVTKEFGTPASPEQLRTLQREIIKTESKMKEYTDAQNRATGASDDLKQQAGKAASAVKSEGEAAKKAAPENKALKEAGEKAAKGLKAAAVSAGTALTSIIALGEKTRDYRRELGKLDTAFETSGHTQESARETYKSLQSVLGDTDQAVEAANHLAKLTDTEEELNKWTETLTGVYATFGASLPIEGLTEAANETAKTGQITGNLADALNWATKEGETFGVQLKQNVEFTELTADEVDQLTEAEQLEYEAKKAQCEAVEAYNQSVMDAKSAEDFFNIALAECSTEQERQTLITETLNEMYSEAADTYKKTNEQVIHANEVQERLNAAMAEAGDAVEPVVVDIKELGIELLESAEKPLKKVTDFIQKKFIPGLRKFSDWSHKNMPVIIGLTGGATAGLGAYKAVAIGAKAATEGLTVATWLQVAAQKALNAAMKVNPIGLAIGAALTLAGAIVGIVAASKDTETAFDRLSESERKLSEEARETAESFREQQQATQDAIAQSQAEMGHVQELADELFTLADANGVVQEKNKGRVEFILGQLNNALGTEYSMNGNLIQQYGELAGSVENAIEKKKAELLLEAYEEDYVAAIKNKGDAYKETAMWQQEYSEACRAAADVEDEWHQESIRIMDELRRAESENNTARKIELQQERQAAKDRYEAAVETQEGIKAELDKSAKNLENYLTAIDRYEDAAALAAQGRTDEAIALLDKKTGAYQDYGDGVDGATKQVLDSLYAEAVEAGRAAKKTRKNFENGVKGYTKEMVIEAERGYAEALSKYADAKYDATGIAEDWNEGMATGIDGTRYKVLDEVDITATALSESAEDFYVAGQRVGEYYGDGLNAGIQSKIDAARDAGYKIAGALDKAARGELAVYSPSRKAIEIGEYYGEGLEIGLKRGTPRVRKAAKQQAAELLGAQDALRRPAMLAGAVRRMQALGRGAGARDQGNRRSVNFDVRIDVSGAGSPLATARQISRELETMVRRRLAIEGT